MRTHVSKLYTVFYVTTYNTTTNTIGYSTTMEKGITVYYFE